MLRRSAKIAEIQVKSMQTKLESLSKSDFDAQIGFHSKKEFSGVYVSDLVNLGPNIF